VENHDQEHGYAHQLASFLAEIRKLKSHNPSVIIIGSSITSPPLKTGHAFYKHKKEESAHDGTTLLSCYHYVTREQVSFRTPLSPWRYYGKPTYPQDTLEWR
jgi:hypothetical protein